jgi:hypothetical protein
LANFSIIGYGSNYIDYQFSNLQYTSDTYDYFEVDVYADGSYVQTIDRTSTAFSTSVTFRMSANPSTNYGLSGYAIYNGDTFYIGDAYCTTLGNPPSSPFLYAPSVNGSNAELNIDVSSNTDYIRIYCDGSVVTDYFTNGSVKVFYTVDNLSRGNHTAYCIAHNDDGQATSNTITFWVDGTPNDNGWIYPLDIQGNTVNFHGDCDNLTTYVQIYVDTVLVKTIYPSSAGSYQTFSDSITATAGTHYIKALMCNANGCRTTYSNEIQFEITNPLPSPWAWTTGCDSDGYKLQFDKFEMDASEWNAFTDKINEFRAYKDLPEYSFYTVSSDEIFWDWIYNQAVSAISDLNLYSSIPYDAGNATSEGRCYADTFNDLMKAINNVS